MAKATLNKCCFCIDLRTGSLMIAYIQLVFGIASMIFVAYSFSVAQDNVAGSVQSLAKTHSKLIYNLKHIDERARLAETEKTLSGLMSQIPKILEFIIMYYLLIVSLMFIAFNVSLLIGIHMYKPIYIKVYMIFMMVALVFNILGWLLCFASTQTNLGLIIALPISSLVFAFFLLNIRSYYHNMNNPNVEDGAPMYHRTK